MFFVRNIEKTDFNQIREINFMLWLSLQWNQCFHYEDSFVAVDGNVVLGVAALSYGGTWYYLEENRNDIPLYCLQIELVIKGDIAEELAIKSALVTKLKQRLFEYKKQYPDKKLCIRCWCESEDKKGQSFWLSQRFGATGIIWIMGFDLSKEIPSYPISSEIAISQHDFDDDGMNQYLEANTLGYDGVQDAEAELRFRLNGGTTVVFTAKVDKKVVASVIVWNIAGGRSATENIFTIPEYRRRNIGKSTVATALTFLKKRGDQLATLTCSGNNIPAISMYLQMGYEIIGHMTEMHFEV